jgi:cytochrome bd-type quinol oxidase subunit 2
MVILGGMNQDHEHINTLNHLARDVATRATVAVGLAAIGVIHLLDSVGKYSETRYLFWMYIALIAGCIAVAGAVLFTRSRAAFLAAAALAGSAAIGYVLSRSTGLPSATGDIGNWTEPLGLASLFVEASVVAVAGAAYLVTRRAPAALRSPSRPIAARRSIQAS